MYKRGALHLKIIAEQKDLNIKNLYRALMTAILFIAASSVGYLFQCIIDKVTALIPDIEVYVVN
jgi:hypothetical protein